MPRLVEQYKPISKIDTPISQRGFRTSAHFRDTVRDSNSLSLYDWTKRLRRVGVRFSRLCRL